MDTSHPRELISSLCLLTKHNGVPTKLHQEPTSDEAIREEAEEALPWGTSSLMRATETLHKGSSQSEGWVGIPCFWDPLRREAHSTYPEENLRPRPQVGKSLGSFGKPLQKAGVW